MAKAPRQKIEQVEPASVMQKLAQRCHLRVKYVGFF